MKCIKQLLAAIAIFASFGATHATELSGSFNHAGYDVVQFHVDNPATVDFLFTGGYGDASIGLFNSTGALLILNDDSVGLQPHLTNTLTAGNYSLLVTYCCNWINAMPGYAYSNTDGFNNGSYYFSNTATLDSMTAFLATYQAPPTGTYQITATNAVVGATNVPEPGSVALFGATIAALGMVRRRKQAN